MEVQEAQEVADQKLLEGPGAPEVLVDLAV